MRRPTSREFWSFGPAMLMLFVFGAMLFVVVHVEATRDDEQEATTARVVAQAEALANETIERRIETCVSTNNSRSALQSVLEQVASPSGAAALDFEAVAGFSQLDPATQFYLIQLGAALLAQDDGGTTRIQRIAEDFAKENPQVDCTKLRTQLVRDLKEKPSG